MNIGNRTYRHRNRHQLKNLGYPLLHNALMSAAHASDTGIATTTAAHAYLQPTDGAAFGSTEAMHATSTFPRAENSNGGGGVTTDGCAGGILCYDFWDSATWFNFTNFTNATGKGVFDDEGHWIGEENEEFKNNWYVLVLVVIVFAGVMGNLLVCIAITIEPKLQNVTNYFLLSLSIADLFVCFFVMPISIVNEIMGYWPFGLIVCDVWQVLDVMMCTSSIMHMCFISLDRYITMSNPLKLRNKSRTVVGIKIATVWFISLAIASPIILLGVLDRENVLLENQCAIFNPYFLLYGSLAAFFIPLVIMLIAYTLTIRLLSTQAKKCGGGGGGMRRSMSKKHTKSDINKASNGAQNGMTIAKLLKNTVVDRGRAHPSEVEPLHRKQSQLERSDRQSESVSSNYTTSRQHSTLSTSSSSTARSCQNNLLCVEITTCGHRLSQSSIQSNSSGASSVTEFTDAGNAKPKFQSLMKKHSGAIKAAGILLAKREETIKKKQMNSVKTEQKAVKVLGTMFAIFVVCWAPFFSINLAMGVCSTCAIDVALFKVFLWLGYVSSTLNPIIYTIFNKTFKKTFLRILRCQLKKNRIQRHPQRFLASKAVKQNGSSAVKVTCHYDQIPNPEEFRNLQESNV